MYPVYQCTKYLLKVKMCTQWTGVMYYVLKWWEGGWKIEHNLESFFILFATFTQNFISFPQLNEKFPKTHTYYLKKKFKRGGEWYFRKIYTPVLLFNVKIYYYHMTESGKGWWEFLLNLMGTVRARHIYYPPIIRMIRMVRTVFLVWA